MDKIKEQREKRAGLVEQARAILDKADEETRALSAEEVQQWDKLDAEIEQLGKDISRRETQQIVELELAASAGRQADLQMGGAAGGAKSRTIELRTNVCGDRRVVVLAGEQASEKYEQAFRRFLRSGETRDLQQDSDVAGGFLVPQAFSAELIKGLDNLVFMRQICRVLPPLVRADSLGIPTLDTDVSDPVWTPELGTGDADTAMAFGKREFKPQPLAKRILISKTLIRNSAVPIDGLVRERLAYKFGVAEENNFLNGSGQNSPLGIFTASADGIPTTRDVSSGNTTTEIRFDGLIEALYSLKAQYRRSLNWIFHRDAVKMIRKLKDGEGRYIWQASVAAAQPDTILNVPVRESEYAPNTFTGTKYVGLIGDFSNYWIADSLEMSIQVLIELYALTNQIAYLSRKETDGSPVDANAFARVKLA